MTQRRHGLNEGCADRVALIRPRPVVDPTPTPVSEAREGTPPPKIGRPAGPSMPPLAHVDRKALKKIFPLQTLLALTMPDRPVRPAPQSRYEG